MLDVQSDWDQSPSVNCWAHWHKYPSDANTIVDLNILNVSFEKCSEISSSTPLSELTRDRSFI